MMRIKIPFGGVTPEQLETLADLSEEYADGVISRDDAPGFSVSLRPHRRHARAHAPARRRRDHDARSLRQRRAQCHGLPAGGNLPRRKIRHDALRQGLRANFSWAIPIPRTSAAR